MKNYKVRFCLYSLIFLLLLIALVGCGQTSSPPPPEKVVAEEIKFPTGPVTWVIPYTSGASYDTLARAIAPMLSENLGVPVIVENIPGAQGYNRVYTAKPDGHTIAIADSIGQLAQRLVQPQVFDFDKFTFLGRLNAGVNLFVASPSSGYKSIEDLRAAKGTVRIAAFAGLSAPAIQGLMLGQSLGIPVKLVNFEGPAEAQIGVIRGDADIGALGTTPWLDHIKAGNAIPILIWSDEKSEVLPDVPTLQDIGFPQLKPFMNHRTIIAPPNTPEAIEQKLVQAFKEVLASDAAQKWLIERKYETNDMWGDEFIQIAEELDVMINKNKDIFLEATK